MIFFIIILASFFTATSLYCGQDNPSIEKSTTAIKSKPVEKQKPQTFVFQQTYQAFPDLSENEIKSRVALIEETESNFYDAHTNDEHIYKSNIARWFYPRFIDALFKKQL